jgi:DNA repair exonuclease SbcCD ATPase subunit
MNDISELERRILYALERIGRGTEALAGAGRAGGPGGDAAPGLSSSQSLEIDVLKAELEAERIANAQLTERVRAIKDKQENMVIALETRVARLTQQLDAAEAELQRQRQLNGELTHANQRLSDAAREGMNDPGAVNESLVTELKSLRAARAAEIAEMEEIMAELRPLIGEVA